MADDARHYPGLNAMATKVISDDDGDIVGNGGVVGMIVSMRLIVRMLWHRDK
jgi:hypothetical protein